MNHKWNNLNEKLLNNKYDIQISSDQIGYDY